MKKLSPPPSPHVIAYITRTFRDNTSTPTHGFNPTPDTTRTYARTRRHTMTEGAPSGGLSDQVGELKEEGNKFFRAAEYLKAAAAYTKAIKMASKEGYER